MMASVLNSFIILIALVMSDVSLLAQAKNNSSRQGKAESGEAKETKAKKPSRPKKTKQAVEADKEADPLEDTSTSFDFDETLLEGKFKAPSGMVLKGRVQQSKSQMVQLRKNFRPDLQKSSAAVRAIRPRD